VRDHRSQELGVRARGRAGRNSSAFLALNRRTVDEQLQIATQPAALISRSLAQKVIIATLVGVLTYGVLLFHADARSFAANLAKLTTRVFAYALLWSLANFGIRAVRWQYYLRRLGLTVDLGESLLVFLAGFAMSITPAKSGEVLKSLMLR